MEVERLIKITEAGEKIIQETRSYDAGNNSTFSLRSKEEADDYRYFADPDLTPFNITDAYLNEIKQSLPALPEELENKYQDVFNLPAYDAQFICSDKAMVEYFEAVIKHTTNYKAAVNWLMGPVKSYLNENNIEINGLSLHPPKIAELVKLVDDGQTSFSIASTKVFNSLLQHPEKSALQVATELNLLQENDTGSIAAWVDEVIKNMPDKVAEYKKGKKGLMGMFAGEVKKVSKGKADMQAVNKLLAEKLG